MVITSIRPGEYDRLPPQSRFIETFSQVAYEVVSEDEYVKVRYISPDHRAGLLICTQMQLENRFDSGQYTFKIEDRTFSMAEYSAFVGSLQEEIQAFKSSQAIGTASETDRCVQGISDTRVSYLIRSATVEKESCSRHGVSSVGKSWRRNGQVRLMSLRQVCCLHCFTAY